MPGPPINLTAARRNRRGGATRLPAEGYRGRLPKWPLPDPAELTTAVAVEESAIAALEDKQLDGKLTRAESQRLTAARRRLAVAEETLRATRVAETELWRQLWRTPQATEWIKLRWTRGVAMCVRLQVTGELLGSIGHAREARMWAETLGLSPRSMRSLSWTVEANETPEQSTSGTAPSRRRMAAIDDLEQRRVAAVDEPEDPDGVDGAS